MSMERLLCGLGTASLFSLTTAIATPVQAAAFFNIGGSQSVVHEVSNLHAGDMTDAMRGSVSRYSGRLATGIDTVMPYDSHPTDVAIDTHAPVALSGCHAWAPVFRPILPILGAGQIQVALPTFVPWFGYRVYPHASVLLPPKTYRVSLTTSPSNRSGAGRLMLRIKGNAGKHMGALGRGVVVHSHHKTLHVHQVTHGLSSIIWYWKAGGITYTVSAPAHVPMALLLRVAESLTPGVLVRAPITSGPTPQYSACP
ncbi:MAG: hypothetical protein NVSMB52_03700 [Chloroflexota bacterium]